MWRIGASRYNKWYERVKKSGTGEEEMDGKAVDENSEF